MQQQRYEYGEFTGGEGLDLQDPNAMSNSNNQFGNGGSYFANMDWGAIVGGITGMVGDIWGQPDVIVQPGIPQTNIGQQDSGTDSMAIIMIGGMALLGIVILVVAVKLIK